MCIRDRNPQTNLESNGCISYDEALRAGYVRVVEWLLKHGASVEKTPSGATPLSLAAERGYTALIEMLVAKGAPVEGQPLPKRVPPQPVRIPLALPPAQPLYAAAAPLWPFSAALLLDK